MKLDFLGPGKWTMRLWKDAKDAKVQGQHLEIEERVVTAGQKLTLPMAPAGGAVAWFQPAGAK